MQEKPGQFGRALVVSFGAALSFSEVTAKVIVSTSPLFCKIYEIAIIVEYIQAH